MSQFAELLAQLQAEQEQSEAMAKSVPAEGGKDDDAIQAAAAEAGDTDADDNPEDDDDAPVAKSVLADDGQEYIDATEMLKSLESRVAEHDDVRGSIQRAADARREPRALWRGQGRRERADGLPGF